MNSSPPYQKASLLQIAECASTGEMKSIYDVANGLACNCVLPGTDEPLIAKNKGKRRGEPLSPGQRAPHFALTTGANPQHAIESAIHKLAKRVFAQTKRLWLPKIEPRWEWDENLDRALAKVIPLELPSDLIAKLMDEGMQKANEELNEKFKARLHDFGAVDLEVRLDSTDQSGQIIVDAIGLNEGLPKLLVEFHFTNPVSPEKKARIQVMNRSCLEIDLSRFVQLDESGQINRQGMIEELQSKFGFPRHWVHNVKRDQIEDSIIKRVSKKVGLRAQRLLARHQKQRSQEFLTQQLAAGFTQKKVYTFKGSEAKVYCPKSKVKDETVRAKECQACPFFGEFHFALKSDEQRMNEPGYVAKFSEEMSVLCGHSKGLSRNVKRRGVEASGR